MLPRAEMQCLVFYAASFLMWRMPKLSYFPLSLSILVLFPVSDPVPVFATAPISVPDPVSTTTALVSVLAPVSVPVRYLSSRFCPRFRSLTVPAPVPIPVLPSFSLASFPVPVSTSSPLPSPSPSPFSFPPPSPPPPQSPFVRSFPSLVPG